MRLQARHQTIQRLLDASYDDRLNGVMSEDLFVRKRSQWEAGLVDIQVAQARQEEATHRYQDEALKLLELAQRAKLSHQLDGEQHGQNRKSDKGPVPQSK